MARKSGTPKFIRVSQAAEMLHRCPLTIYRHVWAGRLKAKRVDGRLWLRLDDVVRFAEERKA